MSSTAGAIDRLLATGDATNVQRQIVIAGWMTGCVLLVGLALVLMERRVSGAFTQPLGAWAVVGIAIGLEVVVVALRRVSLSTQYSVLSTAWQFRLGSQNVSVAQVVPGIAAVIALASLTIPGTSALGLVLAWLVVIAGEAGQWLIHHRPNLFRDGQTRLMPPAVELPVTSEEPEIPTGLVQQVTRVLEGDRESVHALVRADVAANDRFAVVHLAFCPPLAARPELTAHAMDADDAEVRVTQAEAFGARIEVRLPKVEASPRSVLIEAIGSVTSRRGS